MHACVRVCARGGGGKGESEGRGGEWGSGGKWEREFILSKSRENRILRYAKSCFHNARRLNKEIVYKWFTQLFTLTN